jgi:ABC-type antimicrobial peptide transport system permease subunit
MTTVGLVVGGVLGTFASRAITQLLYGVSRVDPVTYINVIASLLPVAFVECLIPAVRAARVDPAVALRQDCAMPLAPDPQRSR